MINKEGERIPSIRVYISSGHKYGDVVTNASCGVEEESIPFEVEIKEGIDAVSLAYEAALDSVLQVGIGIDGKGGLAVHYKKLPEHAPLFNINYINEPDKVRSVCANAARLVKGTPFTSV